MRKQILDTSILSNEEIAEGIYRITFAYGIYEPEEAGSAEPASAACQVVPGQFVNLYLRDGSMLLPRPISICRLEKGRLSLVYRAVGKGTKALAEYKAGDLLRVSSPLGHGYEVDVVFQKIKEETAKQAPEIEGQDSEMAEQKPEMSGQDSETAEQKPEMGRIVLVAGGLGIPPMVELAKAIRERTEGKAIRLCAMAGFPAKPFLMEELGAFCDEVYIATEDGSTGFRGNVVQLLEQQESEEMQGQREQSQGKGPLGWEQQAEYYLACGPKPMLEALAAFCAGRNKPLQVSLEERMGCGYGACVGCTCRTREGKGEAAAIRQKKVCKDGPVFFGEEVVWDE